jgi:hypothetical protein
LRSFSLPKLFGLERGPGLQPPNFFPLATNIVGRAGTTSSTDTTATAISPLFYRVSIQYIYARLRKLPKIMFFESLILLIMLARWTHERDAGDDGEDFHIVGRGLCSDTVNVRPFH